MIEILKGFLELIMGLVKFEKDTAKESQAVSVDAAMEKSKLDETEDLQKEVGKLLK